MPPEAFLVAAALALVAALYSSVGHGGASGYLAVMAIAGFAPEELRPTALLLNLIVAAIATWRFAPHFHWRLFWPFAVASIPTAFAAGKWIHLGVGPYNMVLGFVLLYVAWRLLGSLRDSVSDEPAMPALPLAIAAGVLIGVLSGAIGIGGGIFLSPLIILAGWANPRHTAAVSAPFVLVNSMAALAGLIVHAGGSPVDTHRLAVFAGAVLAGGLIGSTLGGHRLNQNVLRRLLAIVLLVAALKMIHSTFVS